VPTIDVSQVASSIGALSTIYTSQTLNNALATHQSHLASGSRLMAEADDVSISSSATLRQQTLKNSLASLGDRGDVAAAAKDSLAKARERIDHQMGGQTAEAVSGSDGEESGLSNQASGAATTDRTASSVATWLEAAMSSFNSRLGELSGLSSQLTFKGDALAEQQLNTEAVYNRIMNANMAEEALNASKYSILQQTSTAMLAQANTSPQTLLQLFR